MCHNKMMWQLQSNHRSGNVVLERSELGHFKLHVSDILVLQSDISPCQTVKKYSCAGIYIRRVSDVLLKCLVNAVLTFVVTENAVSLTFCWSA